MGSYFSKPEAAPKVPDASTADVTHPDPAVDLPEKVQIVPSEPDLAHIVSLGLHQDPDPSNGLNETLNDLRAKYGFVRTDEADPLAEEARLRALLKGKRKAVYEPLDDSESSDSSDSSSSAEETTVPSVKRRKVAGSIDGDSASDDEVFATQPTTAHEVADEPVDKPPFEFLPDEAGALSPLGQIQGIVARQVVIKSTAADTSTVFDAGTIVCLADRRCLGYVAETFGPVQAPCYLVRFESSDDPLLQPDVISKGSLVFYAPYASKASLVAQIKAQSKPSDASNVHDEEVAAHEMDFSDDEQEAAYKRALKEARQSSVPRHSQSHTQPPQAAPYQPVASTSRASEADLPIPQRIDDDFEYTPLQRPSASAHSPGLLDASAEDISADANSVSAEASVLSDHSQQPHGEGNQGKRTQGRTRGKKKGRGGGNGAGQQQQPHKPKQHQQKPYAQDGRRQYQRPNQGQPKPPNPSSHQPPYKPTQSSYNRPGDRSTDYRPPYLPAQPTTSSATSYDVGYDPFSPASTSGGRGAYRYQPQAAPPSSYSPYQPQQQSWPGYDTAPYAPPPAAYNNQYYPSQPAGYAPAANAPPVPSYLPQATTPASYLPQQPPPGQRQGGSGQARR